MLYIILGIIVFMIWPEKIMLLMILTILLATHLLT